MYKLIKNIIGIGMDVIALLILALAIIIGTTLFVKIMLFILKLFGAISI